jgi:hypothetical protein
VEPRRMWALLAVVVALLAVHRYTVINGGQPVAMLNIIDDSGTHQRVVTETDCIGTLSGLWIEHAGRFHCIAYVGPIPAQAGNGKAVIFFGGDIPDDQKAEQTTLTYRKYLERVSQDLTEAHEIAVIRIGRIGTMGSTGYHDLGGSRIDAEVMDQAVNQIKRIYGLRQVGLAGQSGGSRLVAQLLALGRSDVVCTAMASGAYDVPRTTIGGRRALTNIFGETGTSYMVPMRNVETISRSTSRRDFVIGDPLDKITQFDEQRAWADKLRDMGHKVMLIEAKARDEKNHGLGIAAMRAAATCAKGLDDREVAAAATMNR